LILKNARNGKIKLIGSDVLKFEINKTPNPIRKFKLLSLLRYYGKFVVSDERVRIRAMELSKFGFGSFDAFHIACAEMEKVDVMLTTDDKILKLFMKNLKSIKISIKNPIQWIQEYVINES